VWLPGTRLNIWPLPVLPLRRRFLPWKLPVQGVPGVKRRDAAVGRLPGRAADSSLPLDAGIALTPAGDHATRLSLAGAYRPPLGSVGVGLDKAIFDTVAEATIRSLPARIADTLIRPPGPGSAAGRKPA